jgi:hypothetical protein
VVVRVARVLATTVLVAPGQRQAMAGDVAVVEIDGLVKATAERGGVAS